MYSEKLKSYILSSVWLQHIRKGERVLVALSGGPDSCALLHVLKALKEELSIDLLCAHFEHGIRGDESTADAVFSRRFAGSLGVEYVEGNADVPGLARNASLSIEEAARVARHGFLRDTAEMLGCQWIALGHTADDRAETVLLNIIRGTGIDGIAAMPDVRGLLARPLLGARRTDTLGYCCENGIEARLDSSNDNLNYSRNRLRKSIIPALKSEFNPRITEALLRLGELAAEDAAYLNVQAAELVEKATLPAGAGNLDASVLRDAPLSLQRRALRKWISAHRSNSTVDLDAAMIDAIVTCLNKCRDTNITLPGDGGAPQHVVLKGQKLSLVRKTPQVQANSWQVRLTLPGVTVLPGGDFIVVEILAAAEVAALELGGKVYLNEAVFTNGLAARSWIKGDRFRPKQFSGTKKVSDLYTDCKLRGNDRMSFPVLCDAGNTSHVLAVIGLRNGEDTLDRADIETIAQQQPQQKLIVINISHSDG